jgi:hypothetical protein
LDKGTVLLNKAIWPFFFAREVPARFGFGLFSGGMGAQKNAPFWGALPVNTRWCTGRFRRYQLAEPGQVTALRT